MQVTAVGPEFPNNNRPKGVDFVRLSAPDLRKVSGQGVWACKALFWLFKNRKSYDFVHFHSGYLYNLVTAIAPIVLNKPFAVLPLGAAADFRADARSNRLPLISQIKRKLLGKADKAFALSEANASELKSLGLHDSKIVRLNNPASDEFFLTAKKQDKKSHNIILVGKLGRGKRPDLMVKALSQLIEAGWHDARLTLVGPFETLEFEKELRHLIDSLGLGNAVHCTGYVSNPSTIMTNLPSAIFALPSSQEGLPGALVESMAAGMPAVVTDVGAMGDIVRAANSGYVVEQRVADIRSAIERIWKDEVLWASYSGAATSYAQQHFSEEAVAKTYLTGLGVGVISGD